MIPRELQQIWNECVSAFSTSVLNASILDFAWSKLKSYFDRDPVAAVARFSYIVAHHHPLVDANKRCAACFLLSALRFMNLSTTLSQYDLLRLFLDAAAGKISEEEFVKIVKDSVR